VGVSSSFPFTFSPNALLEEDGVPLGEWGHAPSTSYRVIGGQYFQALDVPLKAGRYFTDADRAGAEPVAIVNETTVRTLWNGGSALGRRVRMTNMDNIAVFATVVGVVADMRHRGVAREPVPEVFFPYAQRPARTYTMTLVARTDRDVAVVAPELRSAVRAVDAGVPVRVERIEDRLATQLAAPRFRTRLLTGFAIVAVLLAACGIFGVVSYSVARRTRELGIRMALGARAGNVRAAVLRRALVPVLIGLFVGANLALLGSRFLAGLTFGVNNADPVAFIGALVVLLAVACAGAWLPAQRATRVSPLEALRVD